MASGFNAEQLNVGTDYSVGPEFFSAFVAPDVDVNYQLIDAYLDILQTNAKFVDVKRDRALAGKLLIVDTHFFEKCKVIFEEAHAGKPEHIKNVSSVKRENFPATSLEVLMPYVKVTLPRWGRISSILTVININQHWVACEIQLSQGRVVLFDSMLHTYTKDNERIHLLQTLPTRRVLPPLLEYVSFNNRRREDGYNVFPIPPEYQLVVEDEASCYVQKDNSLCAIFSLMSIECCLTRTWPRPYLIEGIDRIRRRMSFDIYR